MRRSIIFMGILTLSVLLLVAGCKSKGEAQQNKTIDLPLYNVSEDNQTVPLPETPEQAASESDNETGTLPEAPLAEGNASLNESVNGSNESLPDALPPAETFDEQAGEGEEGEESGDEGVAIKVLAEKTFWLDELNPNNITREENDRSFFSDVQCAIGTSAEESGFQGNVQSDDLITFTLTNGYDHEFYLPIEKPDDSPTSEAMKLLINSRRIRNADEKCGSNYVKGKESMTCKEVRTVLKSGMSVQGQNMTNKLEANTRYYRTELVFMC